MRAVRQRPWQCLLAATAQMANLDYEKLADSFPVNGPDAKWPEVIEWAIQNLSSSLVRLWLRTMHWRGGATRRTRAGRGLLILTNPASGLRHTVSYEGRLIVDPANGRSYTSLWQLARAYGIRTTEIEVYHWDRQRSPASAASSTAAPDLLLSP